MLEDDPEYYRRCRLRREWRPLLPCPRWSQRKGGASWETLLIYVHCTLQKQVLSPSNGWKRQVMLYQREGPSKPIEVDGSFLLWKQRDSVNQLYIPRATTVNTDYIVGSLRKFLKAFHQKWPDLVSLEWVVSTGTKLRFILTLKCRSSWPKRALSWSFVPFNSTSLVPLSFSRCCRGTWWIWPWGIHQDLPEVATAE